eukprot:Tamp_07066.p1 GENE.Tamp_07066~~Tamp_07066.p1  ORF type:complete len:406 (-),score=5.09 Tamp_07066:1261-2478(-)
MLSRDQKDTLSRALSSLSVPRAVRDKVLGLLAPVLKSVLSLGKNIADVNKSKRKKTRVERLKKQAAIALSDTQKKIAVNRDYKDLCSVGVGSGRGARAKRRSEVDSQPQSSKKPKPARSIVDTIPDLSPDHPHYEWLSKHWPNLPARRELVKRSSSTPPGFLPVRRVVMKKRYLDAWAKVIPLQYTRTRTHIHTDIRPHIPRPYTHTRAYTYARAHTRQDKWVEARGIHSVGYLEDGMVIEVVGAGLATVSNVVRVASVTDLYTILGKDLVGLGIPPRSSSGISPLQTLVQTTDITLTDIDKGRLILFNLTFHSALFEVPVDQCAPPPPPPFPPPSLADMPTGSGDTGRERDGVASGTSSQVTHTSVWDPRALRFTDHVCAGSSSSDPPRGAGGGGGGGGGGGER